MAKVNISFSKINSNNVNTVKYNDNDLELLNEIFILKQFGQPQDYIEQSLYDVNGGILNINYSYQNQKLQSTFVDPSTSTTNTIYIDPEEDISKFQYKSGQFKLLYNFFRKKIADENNKFFIKSISSDRKEIRVANNGIKNDDLKNQVQFLINEIQSSTYYKDYILNFGNNNLILAINIALEQSSPQYNVLFKLYEPLPTSINVKDQFWVVEQIADPVEYDITLTPEFDQPSIPQLRSPNFDIQINEQVNQPTQYKNIDLLLADTSTNFYQELLGILEEKSLKINIDYNFYENFIHFSSAKERLLNFIYKLELIEKYTQDISSLSNIPNGTTITAVSGNINIIQDNINNIINKFDGYERFMYFESGSVSGSNSNVFPKQTSNKPYSLYSVSSSQAITWLGSSQPDSPYYGGQLLSASIYDKNNQNNLIYTIPSFISENPDNINYEVFLNMIGQHFDNVWTYSNSITDLYKADNNLNTGISKDLVFYMLKSLGVKLYNNSSNNNNLFEYMLGFDSTSDIPNPLNVSYTLPSGQNFYLNNLTIGPSGSLTIPASSTLTIYNNLINNGVITNVGTVTTYVLYNNGTISNIGGIVITGPSYITNLISPSSASISGQDYEKEIYKRIYHNLPLLYKSKGTERGLRALISCYGIPDTILRISETGGSDKSQSSIEYNHNRFSYGLRTSGSINGVDTGKGYVQIPYPPSPTLGIPNSIEFRFKTDGLPTSNHTTQSLFEVQGLGIPNSPSSSSPVLFKVELSKNFQTHPIDSLNKNYGNLRVSISGSLGFISSTDIPLPYYDGGWWNVLLNQTYTDNTVSYTLYAKNNIGSYIDNQNGDYIGFSSSSTLSFTSASGPPGPWIWNSTRFNTYWSSSFSTSSLKSLYLGGTGIDITGSNNNNFEGLFQEFRYWSSSISENSFNYHVLNPNSYEDTYYSSSYSNLIYRLPLGNDLKVNYSTGTYISSSHVSQSLLVSSSYISGTLSQSFESTVDQYYFNSPYMGALDRVNNKIRISSASISNNVLSPISRLEKVTGTDLVQDLHLMEVAFSPQNEINDDIISQLGFLNIDEYIGDPSEDSSNQYTSLENLKTFYFQKYTTNYGVFDYIRLISFFNNSLFKMIKDFVPARANVSTGVVIKPHILERNKQPRLPLAAEQFNYSSSIASGSTDGDSGGVYESFTISLNNYNASISGSLGIITQVGTFNEEYYNGELGGSVLRSIKGPFNPFSNPIYT